MVIDPGGPCGPGRIGSDAGPDGQFAFWAFCECGWHQKSRSRSREDAEVELAAHHSDTPLPICTSDPDPPTQVVTYSVTDWDVMNAQARTLAKSNMVPAAYKNKPDEIVAAALYGRELGLGLTASLSYVQVIQGKPGLSAEGMVALVRSRGHSISGRTTDKEAYAVGKRVDTGDEMEVVWTMAMAERAGLLKNPTWKSYPESMLWARAVSQLCRSLFSDVIMGLSYTPEELQDFTPGPTPARGRVPAQESGSPGRSGQSPAPALPPAQEPAQCPECYAPADKQHATKCRLRGTAA